MLVQKKFWSEKKRCYKKIFDKKKLSPPKNFGPNKNFGPKNNLGPKIQSLTQAEHFKT